MGDAIKVLDLSAGNRAIWFNPNHAGVTFLDIRPEVRPTIVCDTRDLPAEVGDGYDLVVFDPPHKNNAASGKMAVNYGHWTAAHIRDTLARSAAEAWRVSRPGALMAFKWNDHTLSLSTALRLLSDFWTPLFGHGVKGQQRHETHTSWVMLARRDNPATQEPADA